MCSVVFFFFNNLTVFCVKDVLQHAAGQFTNKQSASAIMFMWNYRLTLTFTHPEVQLDP